VNVTLAGEWASLVQAVATVAAVIVGGVWAYFRFFRDRTYWPRLELSVTSRPTRVDDHPAFLFTATVQNVGLSRVDIKQEGTALVIATTERSGQTAQTTDLIEWRSVLALVVLEDHGWIEAGETIVEDHIVFAESATRPVRATFRIVEDAKRSKSWSAMTIGACQVAAQATTDAAALAVGSNGSPTPPATDAGPEQGGGLEDQRTGVDGGAS
jgi:hypothetical protein